MMTLDNFRVGDKLVLTCRSLKGEERRAAEVTYINYNNLGRVTFRDRYFTDLLPSGQGSFIPEQVGTTPYGLVKVEIVR